MSGWFLLASVIVQYQRKIKLLNKLNKSESREKFRLDLLTEAVSCDPPQFILIQKVNITIN